LLLKDIITQKRNYNLGGHIMTDANLNKIMYSNQINLISVKSKTGSIRPINTKELVEVRKVIDSTIKEIGTVWDGYSAKEGSNLWITVLSIVNKVINAVEKLDKLGIKDINKKNIAMTIIETVIDEQDITIKVFGIKIPFAKGILKKRILHFADQLIDWLVEHIFNKNRK